MMVMCCLSQMEASSCAVCAAILLLITKLKKTMNSAVTFFIENKITFALPKPKQPIVCIKFYKSGCYNKKMVKAGHSKIILAVMCLCVILIIATVAAINVSVPHIETSSLHPSNSQLLWIVDLYVIVFA